MHNFHSILSCRGVFLCVNSKIPYFFRFSYGNLFFFLLYCISILMAFAIERSVRALFLCAFSGFSADN